MPLSISTASARPSAWRSAVSNDSASRCFASGAHLQPVDDDFDGVLDVLLELGQLVELVHLAVDADAHEALRAQLVEEIRLLAFAPDDERREDHEPRVLAAASST